MLCVCEALDSRLLLSATPDAGNVPARAMNLGAITHFKAVSNTLDARDARDYFTFAVGASGNVNASIGGLKADATLRLFSRTGRTIAISATEGTAPEFISESLEPGRYYLRVAAATPGATTAYTLRLQADLNWTSIVQGGQRKEVGVVFADGSTGPIRSNRQTWLIVHGWQSGPSDVANIADAVRALQPKDQVLVIDWSAPAGADLLTALGSVTPAAAAAAKVVKQWKIPGSRLNLIGHSFGGYFIDRFATQFSAGVNRLVAIDPADDPTADVNYAARSRFSLAFVATTTYSTPKHALTADETFKMDVGASDSIISHMAAADLYGAMLQADADGSPDDISKLFALDRLAPTIAQPWKTGSSYEGTLTGQGFLIFGWKAKTLVYRSATNGRTVTVEA